MRESQRKPLILAVEDLHWIDKTSEEFLDYLIGFLPTARILLILLYRPEYTHTWGSKSYYGKIGLDQLSAQTSAELVQAILEGGDVAPEIAGLGSWSSRRESSLRGGIDPQSGRERLHSEEG